MTPISTKMYILDTMCKPVILAGDTSLYYSGLTSQSTFSVMCWTDMEELPIGIDTGIAMYFYSNYARNTIYTEKVDNTKNVFRPTKERAIVESIKFHDYFNEGILIEALQSYLYQVEDLSLLYEVADYFKVNRETIDYWLNEAREESDMSMD